MNAAHKKPTKSEVVHLRLVDSLYKRVRIAADAEHRTISNFLHLAVIEALGKRGAKMA